MKCHTGRRPWLHDGGSYVWFVTVSWVMTAAELAAGGVSRGQLRRLVRRGAWLRLAYGVFAPAGLVAAEAGDRAREHAVRAAAALAGISSVAVVSHHSAALIRGIELLGRRPG
jgi:hypothetical protein